MKNMTEIEGITGQFLPYGGYGGVKKNSVKITKDYSYILKGNPFAPIGQIGGDSREDITFSFKKGQIVEGYIQDLGTNIQVKVGNHSVLIPKSNWEIVVDQSFIQETDLPNPYKVTCKDGTKDVGNGSDPPCIYNGGVNSTPTQIQGNSTKEPIFYILVTAGILVVGYFAYKKFKK